MLAFLLSFVGLGVGDSHFPIVRLYRKMNLEQSPVPTFSARRQEGRWSRFGDSAAKCLSNRQSTSRAEV